MGKINSLNLKIKRKKYSSKFLRITKNKNKVICLGEVNLINKNIIIGENVVIYPNVSFEGEGLIEIGNNVKIGTNSIIHANKLGGIKIEDNTIIAGNCYIIDSNHQIKKNKLIQKQGFDVEKVNIGSDVWIGANSVIIKGAKISNGAVIGANSLVNNYIEEYAIAVGTPAKAIKYREE